MVCRMLVEYLFDEYMLVLMKIRMKVYQYRNLKRTRRLFATEETTFMQS